MAYISSRNFDPPIESHFYPDLHSCEGHLSSCLHQNDLHEDVDLDIVKVALEHSEALIQIQSIWGKANGKGFHMDHRSNES